MAKLTLVPQQRATIGFRSHNAFRQPTHRHIPGTVVRGAFAASWITAHGGRTDHEREEFLDLFEGGVRFGPLFLGRSHASLAIREHKYKALPNCAQESWDTALGDEAPSRCPDCSSPLELAEDRLTDIEITDEFAEIDEKRLAAANVVRRRTHVEITEANVAKNESLYAREELDHLAVMRDFPRGFRGNLIASSQQLDALRELPRVRIGGRLTSHGLMDVSIDPDSGPTMPELTTPNKVVLRLRAPGIFIDDLGRPRRDPNVAELTELLGSPASVERRWTRWAEIGGWHVASGLPKPTEIAVQAGSTYLVTTEEPITDQALAALAMRGLGLRRHEGFGELSGPAEAEEPS